MVLRVECSPYCNLSLTRATPGSFFRGPLPGVHVRAGDDLPRIDPDEQTYVEGFSAARGSLLTRHPSSDAAPLPGGEPAGAWTEFLAFEDRVMSADATCRADAHAEGMTRLGPLLEAMLAEHPELLAQAEAT